MHCSISALLFLARVLPFQFEMRQDSQQRVVDLVGRAQGQLSYRCILLEFGELRLELHLLLGQLALFLQTSHQFLLRHIALVLAMLGEFPGARRLALGCLDPRP